MNVALPPGVRLGCVPYLNAQPLILGIEEQCQLEHPSFLADAFFNGDLDAALIPVAEWFSHPEYTAVDGIGIACNGEVYSVILAGISSPQKVARVYLDQASRTSAMLVKTLLKPFPPNEWKPLPPESAAGWQSRTNEAALLIGTQAIDYREQAPSTPVCDLGSAWKEATGLPFVFAVWLVNMGYPYQAELANSLRQIAEGGMRWRQGLPAGSFEHKYLNSYIQFQINSSEKRAIHKFRTLATEYQLLPESVNSSALGWI